jgi:hypothetical protein
MTTGSTMVAPTRIRPPHRTHASYELSGMVEEAIRRETADRIRLLGSDGKA